MSKDIIELGILFLLFWSIPGITMYLMFRPPAVEPCPPHIWKSIWQENNIVIYKWKKCNQTASI